MSDDIACEHRQGSRDISIWRQRAEAAESALASERAKTAAAEHDLRSLGNDLAAMNRSNDAWCDRAHAAEATIAQAKPLAAELMRLPILEASSGDPAWFRAAYQDWTPRLREVQSVLAAAPTTAFDAALAEARAGALEDLADYLATLNNSDMIVHLIRARADQEEL